MRNGHAKNGGNKSREMPGRKLQPRRFDRVPPQIAKIRSDDNAR